MTSLTRETYRVAARVDVKSGGHGNGTAEVEDGIEHIKDDHQQGVALEGLLDGGRDEVEEREHGEDGHEHVVVDERRVAGVGSGDHVTDEGHDQKSPEEL